MGHETAPRPKKLRDDVLVSVGFTLVQPTADGFDVVRRLSGQLAAHFRYWEILVIVDADEAEEIAPLFGIVPNLRMLKVRSGTSTYRRRFVAASQAIGDVLAITAGLEAEIIDLVAMIETSLADESIVISRRRDGNALDPLVGALGKASGFHVSSRDMQTVVYPRALLDMLAARSDKDLALRFAPRDVSIKITEMLVSEKRMLKRRGLQGTTQRFSLIQKLIVNLAPRVLGLLSILSAVVAFASVFFVCYVVGVWVFIANIQPGWITTSLLMSGTAMFLGLSIFCLSSGLQMIIDLVSTDACRDVIDEHSTVDLFSNVMTELNVDYDSSGVEVEQLIREPMSQVG